MNITVAGTGYVGLSLATLLSQFHKVIALDVVESKVEMVNNRISPIVEPEITRFFNEKKLDLTATTDKKFAYENADLVIVATPTNYNEETHFFDTSSIDDVIENVLKYKPDTPIVIKSTVPIGFTVSMRKKYNIDNIYFSPEFLREGRSLYDNLYPSRIIVGDKGKVGELFSKLLYSASLNKDTKILLMEPTEAEAVKLFANTYLASRVAYFNELDTYACVNNLNTVDIINGMCADPRIGEGYNNPSFGFSGYCFPKDSKQLVANFSKSNIPEKLMTGVVESNKSRKEFIANDINTKYPEGAIGIYKTAMKANSDNNRCSSILDVAEILKNMGRNILCFDNCNSVPYEKVNSVEELASKCSVIVTNRLDDDKLVNYMSKVYTRDVFGNN